MRRGSGVAVGVEMVGHPYIPIQKSVPVVDYRRRSWSEGTVVNFSSVYSLTRTRHGLWKRRFGRGERRQLNFCSFCTLMRVRHGLWPRVPS